MKLFPNSLFSSFTILLISGCGIMNSRVPTFVPSPLPSATPIAATVDDVCNYISDEVTITGYIYYDFPPGGYINPPLYFYDSTYPFPIYVFLERGTGMNQMEGYSKTTLVITTDDGSQVGNNASVTITGTVEESYQPIRCSISVKKILPAP